MKSNTSSHKEGHGLLSADSSSVISLKPQEQTISNVVAKNAEYKSQLHKSRKNNAVLRSKITKLEKENEELRNTKVDILDKVEKLEKARQRDAEYINRQEKEIQSLNDRLNRARKIHSEPNRNHTQSEPSETDLETEELKNTLNKVIDVKMKYENIIKALLEKPEYKPVILNILEQLK